MFDIAIPFYICKMNCYITAVKPMCDDECRRALTLNSFQCQQDLLYEKRNMDYPVLRTRYRRVL
jgi:hypothetical protein